MIGEQALEDHAPESDPGTKEPIIESTFAALGKRQVFEEAWEGAEEGQELEQVQGGTERGGKEFGMGRGAREWHVCI
jgi:hypothetical protein